MEHKKNVLLIDDDEINNFYVTYMLEKTGEINEIFVALNGKEGLEKMESLNQNNTSIDFILLDINMPIMNGFEFLNHYQVYPNKQKITKLIALIGSAVNSEDYTKTATFKCVDAIIEKPLTEEKITQILQAKKSH